MGRILPWAKKKDGIKQEPSEPKIKREKEVKQELPAAKVVVKKEDSDSDSNASMKSGMDADDQWKMVEDELLAIAQSKTKSLHREEYEERMAQAKERVSADPMAGKKVDEYYVQSKMPPPRIKRQSKLTNEDDSDGEVVDENGKEFLSGTAVGALLASPKRKEVKLADKKDRRKPGTRAAAGLKPFESFSFRDSQSQYTQGNSLADALSGSFLIPGGEIKLPKKEPSTPTPRRNKRVELVETQMETEDDDDDDLDKIYVKKPKIKQEAVEDRPTKVRVLSEVPSTPPKRKPATKEHPTPKPILKSSPPKPEPIANTLDDDDPIGELLQNLGRRRQRVKQAPKD